MTNPFCLPKKLTHQNTNIMFFPLLNPTDFRHPRTPQPPHPHLLPSQHHAPKEVEAALVHSLTQAAKGCTTHAQAAGWRSTLYQGMAPAPLLQVQNEQLHTT